MILFPKHHVGISARGRERHQTPQTDLDCSIVRTATEILSTSEQFKVTIVHLIDNALRYTISSHDYMTKVDHQDCFETWAHSCDAAEVVLKQKNLAEKKLKQCCERYNTSEPTARNREVIVKKN